MKCWVTCDNNCKILECQTNSDEQQCILKKVRKELCFNSFETKSLLCYFF